MKACHLVAAVALALLGCHAQKDSDCKPNTLHLELGLHNSALYADSVTVQVLAAKVSQSFPHNPPDPTPLSLDIGFPGGYPADQLDTVLITAYSGTAEVGRNVLQVRFSPKCTSARIPIFGTAGGGNQTD